MNLNMNPIIPPVYNLNLFPNISNIGLMGMPLITQPVWIQSDSLPFDNFSSPFPIIPSYLHSPFVNPFGGLMNVPMTTSVLMESMLTTTVPVPILPNPVNSDSVPVNSDSVTREKENDEFDGEGEWAPQYRCIGLSRSIPEEHSLPGDQGRVHRCTECGALLFKDELTKSKKGKFSRCCQNGNIVLPKFPEVEDELNQIFVQPTYREMSRKLNHAMAFACWKCNEDKFLRQQLKKSGGVSCIRVQGSAYMVIGSIETEAGKESDPKFIQVFFNSQNEEEAILKTAVNSKIAKNINDVKKTHLEWLTTLHGWIKEHNPIYKVYNTVKNFVPSDKQEVEDMKLVFTSRVPMNVDGDPRTFIDPNEQTGPVRCINNELGAIIDTSRCDGDPINYKHDIVIKKKGGGLKYIDSTHRLKEPLMYPLLFPKGTKGYGLDEYKHQNETTSSNGNTYHKSVSGQQYLRHRLYRRGGSQDMYLNHGRLTQEWILSSFLQIEKNNLNFLRFNQDKLKAGSYKEVQAAMASNKLEESGKHVILPSTYKGSPRDNIQRYCDAMAVVRELGKPSYFITMTCNPKWKEIVDNLPPGLKAHQCPDLIARVFNIKLKALLHDLVHKNVLGKTIGRTHVIEFQKRGLPHAHILLIMDDKDTPKSPDHHDCAVTAEFSENAEVREVQAEFMYHRCNDHCKNDTGRGGTRCCTKGYPKPFRMETSEGDDTYTEYRRRPPVDDDTPDKRWKGGQKNTFTKKTGRNKEEVLDNSRLVPHNIYLLMKYRCHLNVEICNSINAVKYLYKYVYKGHDKVMYGVKKNSQDDMDLSLDQVGQQGLGRDEIDEFVKARYVTTSEACWRAFEFSMGSIYPSVQRLKVHLLDEQQVLYKSSDPEDTREVLAKSEMTQLTAFFMVCEEERLYHTVNGIPWSKPVVYKHGGPPARDMLYRDVAKWYTWVRRNTKKDINPHWKRRTKKINNTVGRIRHVPPTMECKELFHFRLLLNTVKGPTCFEDLRKVTDDDGDVEVCPTYHEAAFRRGLVQDDREWEIVMEESAAVALPCQIRSLFVIILTHGLPQNPRVLWEKYKDSMSEDFKYKRTGRRNVDPSVNYEFIEADYNDALLDIENQLQAFPKSSTEEWGLPATRSRSSRVHRDQIPAEVREALNFNRSDESIKRDELTFKFNEEQLKSFHEINDSVMGNQGKCFFIDGAGGCGKTTVAKALLHAARARGDLALACASSGIAATLLPKGQTAHSTFKIPVEGLDECSTCGVGGLSGRAELLKQVKFVVWDEVFMVHRHGFEAVARLMRHLRREDNLMFGGCTLLILGDLRQTLPVVPGGSRTEIVDACLTRSKKIWKKFTQMTLTQNMRVLSVESDTDREDLARFCDYLIKMGNGELKTDSTGGIKIPDRFLLPPNDPLGLLKWVYGDKPEPLPEEKSCSKAVYNNILDKNIKYYGDKAILCPKNFDVNKMNEDILQTLPGEGRLCLSADAVMHGDDQGLYVTTEFLNKIDLSGLPPHHLRIKIGCVMMLLRNLNPKHGLCNGTRLIVTHTTSRLIKGIILTGSHQGTKCIIPRITVYPSNNPYAFKWGRRQFPLQHAYVMTINKSQGQTFRRTGLLLPMACFAHGQLYVAFSRCGYPPNDMENTGLKVVVYDTPIQGQRQSMGGVRTNDTEGITTQNIVLKEVFKNVKNHGC